MGAGEIILSLLVVIIIVIIGIVIYFNFNNLFPGLKNILNPPTEPPKPETETPKPETETPKPDTKSPKPDTKSPKPDTKSPKPDTEPPKPPKPDTKTPKPPKPPKPDTKSPPPDKDCPPFKPPGPIPKVPIPNGVLLNINDTDKSNMLIQESKEGRIVRANGIITVSMDPKDTDNVTNKTDRQRNEVSIKNSKMVLDVNKKGTWGCNFKLNNNVNWDISKGHYHIIQIKSLDQDQPVFTVSLNGTNICARTGESTSNRYDIIQPTCTAVNNWVPFTVQINDIENGSIMYNINGKLGAFKLPKPLPLFMKVGQYRSAPNNINFTTASAYKDICFIQEP